MKQLLTTLMFCWVLTGIAQKQYLQCGQLLDTDRGVLLQEKTLVIEGKLILEVLDGYQQGGADDELIDLRYQASIDPEVVANPPLQRPKSPRTLWRMDLTRDKRLRSLPNPTLVLWGRDDKVNRPAGGPLLLRLMPNAELVMTSHTGHWMQWERAELFNQLVTDFLSADSRWVNS